MKLTISLVPSVRTYSLYWDFALNDADKFGDRRFSVVIQYKNINSSAVETYKTTILSSLDYNPVNMATTNLLMKKPIEFTFRAPAFFNIVGIGIAVDTPLSEVLSELPNPFNGFNTLSLLDWASSQILSADLAQLSRSSSQAVWGLRKNDTSALFLAYQVTNIGNGWPTVSLYYPKRPFILRVTVVGEVDTVYHEISLEQDLWPNKPFLNVPSRTLAHNIPLSKYMGNVLYVRFEMSAALVDYWRYNVTCFDLHSDVCFDQDFNRYHSKISDYPMVEELFDDNDMPFTNPVSLPKPKFSINSVRVGYNDLSSAALAAWTSGSPAEISLNITATFQMQKAKDFLPKLTT
jgi:hypothetical protein